MSLLSKPTQWLTEAGTPFREQDLPALAKGVGVDPVQVVSGKAVIDSPYYAPTSVLKPKGVDPEKKPHFIGLHPGTARGAMAHELGHARNNDLLKRVLGNRRNANIAQIGSRVAGNLGGVGGTAAGMFGSRAGTIAGTAAQIPMLLDEILASHHGGVANASMDPDQPWYRRAGGYLSAYRGLPTYALGAAMPAAMYAASPWLRRGWSHLPKVFGKRAALLPDVELQEHQQRLQDEAKKAPIRKLLYHALGSGKGLSSIAASEARGEPYTAVLPASLRQNYKGEQKKWTDQKTPSKVMSYSQLGRGATTPYPTNLVFDEAHQIRNPGTAQSQQAYEMADKSKQLLLLSGSPIVNSPGDLAAPLSMLTGKHMSPAQFESRYVGSRHVYPSLLHRLAGVSSGEESTVEHEKELRALLKGHVDYFKPDKDVVPVNRHDIPVTMGVEQSRLYKAMFDKLPWTLRWKLRNEFPLSREELKRTLSFLTGPRQVGLSTFPYLKDKDPLKAFGHSTKLQRAHKELTEHLADPRTKALIFSNFIDAGLTPYAAALRRDKVPHAVFHGGLSDQERKQLVEDYNAGRIRAALLGPSGTEGLSFKGTGLTQILDPYWNPARSRQSEGRALRYDSHTGLPADMQNVKVQRFLSRLPLGMADRLLSGLGFDRSSKTHATDDYLRGMSARKEKLNERFYSLLRDVGTPK